MTAASPANGRRAYRSPRRQQQAAETRAAVFSAAAALFGSRGWSATGMRDVAAEAGVSVETVYANVGSEAARDRQLAADLVRIGTLAQRGAPR